MASILVSEADPDVRRLLVALLQRRGHKAIVLGTDVVVPPRADVLLVDPVAPVSLTHARLVREHSPTMVVICLNPLPDAVRLPGTGTLLFLPKPFAPDALDAMLDVALERFVSPF
jgi:DNA-binding response OmpR family regulator